MRFSPLGPLVVADGAGGRVSRLRKSVHGEEVAGRQALGLGPQKAAPGSVQATRSGPEAPGAEDPPHGRLADVVAEAA